MNQKSWPRLSPVLLIKPCRYCARWTSLGARTTPLVGGFLFLPRLCPHRDKEGLSWLLSCISQGGGWVLIFYLFSSGGKRGPCNSRLQFYKLSLTVSSFCWSLNQHPCLCHSSWSQHRASGPTGSLCIRANGVAWISADVVFPFLPHKYSVIYCQNFFLNRQKERVLMCPSDPSWQRRDTASKEGFTPLFPPPTPLAPEDGRTSNTVSHSGFWESQSPLWNDESQRHLNREEQTQCSAYTFRLFSHFLDTLCQAQIKNFHPDQWFSKTRGLGRSLRSLGSKVQVLHHTPSHPETHTQHHQLKTFCITRNRSHVCPQSSIIQGK